MTGNATRAILCLSLVAAPALAAAQDATLYRLPPPRVSCDAASGLLDNAGQVVPGRLRERCDAVWNQSLKTGGVGAWRYDDFMSRCADSCPAPKVVSQSAGVPQLNTLGAQAAQSAASSGAGSGLSTALIVGAGVADAVGIGVAVATASRHDDRPASP